ncbi:hypothetical protein GUJ93_ZPchr0012g21525 [Zizania palustris]|uniref:Uncharacterized protein n=1 Tax=Zizania palustris TaxID=103762 RepID=A0A8J5WQ74_ZIZPA|nr:hypothetical protein GUJ93_ZPchr0012g21525 [Zizania palustris]
MLQGQSSTSSELSRSPGPPAATACRCSRRLGRLGVSHRHRPSLVPIVLARCYPHLSMVAAFEHDTTLQKQSRTQCQQAAS